MVSKILGTLQLIGYTKDKYTKGCATSLIIREMNAEIMKHYYIPNRMAKIKKRLIIPNTAEDAELEL